ncbi:hypothetical protein [uncultured Duncaniella sp.]|uniref:hypothetical protein n=1 Tax=uncultured Duncaniella sp. TaxID=2768039 RepID=UPI0026150219|nr:hypothetical protein [uncultured Duncaniella sp.]
MERIKILLITLMATIAICFGETVYAQTRVIPEGLTIPVMLTNDINSKNLRKDGKIPLAVSQDIYYNDALVLSEGTPVEAEIIKARKRGVWGKQGIIEFRITGINVNGNIIPLESPAIKQEGHSHKKAANGLCFGTIMFIPLNFIAPLCIKGDDVTIPAGAIYNAEVTSTCYLD